ncbi:hypothetical protein EV426DRAFT_573492 [Tirmania nivea]|nr:hypothetical protein EV426DRAFT_573492 [Tirmania nivea]
MLLYLYTGTPVSHRRSATLLPWAGAIAYPALPENLNGSLSPRHPAHARPYSPHSIPSSSRFHTPHPHHMPTARSIRAHSPRQIPTLFPPAPGDDLSPSTAQHPIPPPREKTFRTIDKHTLDIDGGRYVNIKTLCRRYEGEERVYLDMQQPGGGKKVAIKTFFEGTTVKNRWFGKHWQLVMPYNEDGTLDKLMVLISRLGLKLHEVDSAPQPPSSPSNSTTMVMSWLISDLGNARERPHIWHYATGDSLSEEEFNREFYRVEILRNIFNREEQRRWKVLVDNREVVEAETERLVAEKYVMAIREEVAALGGEWKSWRAGILGKKPFWVENEGILRNGWKEGLKIPQEVAYNEGIFEERSRKPI